MTSRLRPEAADDSTEHPQPAAIATALRRLATRLERHDAPQIRGWSQHRERPHQLADGDWVHADRERVTVFLHAAFDTDDPAEGLVAASLAPTNPASDGRGQAAGIHPAVARHETVVATNDPDRSDASPDGHDTAADAGARSDEFANPHARTGTQRFYDELSD